MAKVAKVTKMQLRKGRTHDRRAVVRKEAKGKRRVAREKPEHVGRVARQATLQRGVDEATDGRCNGIGKRGRNNGGSRESSERQ